MSRFSLANLLLCLFAAGMAMALYVARTDVQAARKNVAETEAKLERVCELEDRLVVVDHERYQVCRVYERDFQRSYPSDGVRIEVNSVRVFVPDASKIRLSTLSGTIPVDGLPKRGVNLQGSFEAGAAELTICLRGIPTDEYGGVAELNVYADYLDGRTKSYSQSTGLNHDCMPWVQRKPNKNYPLAYEPDEPFDLDEPVMLIKRLARSKSNKAKGICVWMTETEAKSSK